MRPYVLAAAGIAVLIAAVALAPAAPALACSCARLDARQGLRQADGAFVGALVSFEVLPGGQSAIYTFEVAKSLKGSLSSDVDVRSAAYGAACGIEADRGDHVGLLLDWGMDGWSSNLCTMMDPEALEKAARHQPATDASADSGSDGDGRRRSHGADVSERAVPVSGRARSLWVLGPSLFAVVAVVIAVRSRRRLSARG